MPTEKEKRAALELEFASSDILRTKEKHARRLKPITREQALKICLAY